jgi:RNA recognition motif-containing protein
MDVYVGNIPDTIKVIDLERLLRPLDRQVQIRLHHHNGKQGPAACYCVCTFSTERLARKAIKKLDGYLLFGRALSVREFLYRSYSNERRALGWRNRPWDGVERRSGERRMGTALAAPDDWFSEPAIEAAAEDIVIEGYREFATKTT